jgi:predicted ATPase
MNQQYNYTELITWLEQKGKKEFGAKFQFIELDIPNITKLICYFLDDQNTAAKLNIDLTKGILLSGPVGCGKTTLMKLMRYVPQANKKFFVKTCRDISFEFIKDGHEVIHRYSHGHNTHAEHKNYCFDDLGIENNLKYFGN